jgi:N-acetylglutamate synthase-like GNAT family acetyltransferase
MEKQFKIFKSLNDLNKELQENSKITDIDILEQKIKKNLLFYSTKNNVKINKNAKDSELLFTLWDNKTLIGCLKILCLNNYNKMSEYFRTLMYISVHNEYKQQGIASTLLTNYFEYCVENKIKDVLYLSPWTKSGWYFLRPLIYRLSDKYNIKLNDKGYIFNWDI